jgi:hypothetical protein
VWECDLVDIQAFSKFNDNYKYLLKVTDEFSKSLTIVPLKSKTGNTVKSAFKSVLTNPEYSTPLLRRLIWLRTDKEKEFLNLHFQDMLKHEGIQFHACRNPDFKFSIIGRAQLSIRDRLYKYFMYKVRTEVRSISKYSRNLSKLTTILSTPLPAWRHQKYLIQTFLRFGKK